MPELLTAPMSVPTSSHNYCPPIEMRHFVQALLSEDVKGNKAEAERRTGVDRGRFYYHFREHLEFRQWFSEQCDLFLGKNEAIPAYSLLSQIVQGDVPAIRTYYELRGKIKSQMATAPTTVVYNIVQFVNPPESTNGHANGSGDP